MQREQDGELQISGPALRDRAPAHGLTFRLLLALGLALALAACGAVAAVVVIRVLVAVLGG